MELEELNALYHFGVKGMKWGVRKKRDSSGGVGEAPDPSRIQFRVNSKGKLETRGGRHRPPSNDAIETAIYRQKQKGSGIQSLSNKEIQFVVQRWQLENQYATLASSRKSKGKKFLDRLLKEGPPASIDVATIMLKDSKDPRVQRGIAVGGVVKTVIKPAGKKK